MGVNFQSEQSHHSKNVQFISFFYSNTLNTTEVDPHSDSLHNGKAKPKNRSSIIAIEVQATTIETACMVIKSIITDINSLENGKSKAYIYIYIYTHTLRYSNLPITASAENAKSRPILQQGLIKNRKM